MRLTLLVGTTKKKNLDEIQKEYLFEVIRDKPRRLEAVKPKSRREEKYIEVNPFFQVNP